MTIPMQPAAPTTTEPDLLLFDGICGLCHGLVQFLLRPAFVGPLRFATLQGPTAASVLARHGRRADDLDQVVLVRGLGTSQEHLFVGAQAVLHVFSLLPPPWRYLAILQRLPNVVLAGGYRIVARLRYRLFGRRAQCMVPSAQQRELFLD